MRKTNAERIRTMMDEELATWIHNITTYLDGDDDEPMVSIYNLDSEKYEELHDSYGDIIEWLRKEADIPESNAGKWIPCSERLPDAQMDTDLDGLVTVETTEITPGGKRCVFIVDFMLNTKEFATPYKVIAWRERPEPYRGGQDE